MYPDSVKRTVAKTLAESMKNINTVMADVLNEISSDYADKMEIDEELHISLSECV